MISPGNDDQLYRHAGRQEAIGVSDILFDKQVDRTYAMNVGGSRDKSESREGTDPYGTVLPPAA
jgi:hypothetical protein